MQLHFIVVTTVSAFLLSGCLATAFGGSPPSKSKHDRHATIEGSTMSLMNSNSCLQVSRLPVIAFSINNDIQG